MVFEKETNLYKDAELASKFTSINTQFNVVNGKISHLISDAEVATYNDGSGTITSRMNSAENTVEQHTQQIGTLNGKFTGVDGTLAEWQADYTEFKQDSSSFELKVTSTLANRTRTFTSEPVAPYNLNDFWIKDNDLYICIVAKTSEQSFDSADWKPTTNRVFRETQQTPTPTPPYNVADLFCKANGEIFLCKTARQSGSYNASDWQKASGGTFDSWNSGTEAGQYQTFSSFIQALPNKINLQVTGDANTDAGTKFAAKAQIIAAINNVTQESEVSINADKIKITGNQGVVAAINGSTATIAAERIELKGNLIVNAINNGTAQISASKIELSSYPTTTDMNTALSEKNGIYRGSSIPTTSNYPASSWDTDAKKQKHIADVYIRSNGDQYQYVQGREGLLITFNPKCATESASYDYVEIYYKIDNTTYKTTKYGGKDSSNNIANAKVFIPSNIFWLYWHTDTSVNNFYGFSIDEIKREFSDDYSTSTGTIPSYTVTEISGSTYPESSHNPYENSDNKLWKYTYSSSFSSDEAYGWAIREGTNSVAGATLSILGTEIISKVSAGDIASTINQTAQSVRIQASKIDLDGYATFTALSTQGQTAIHGGNITTGKIAAERITLTGQAIIDAVGATSLKIAAKNLTLDGLVSFTNLTDGSTTISGNNIKTGTIDASTVTVDNINASKIKSGTLDGVSVDIGGWTYRTVISKASNGGFIDFYGRKNTSDSYTWIGDIQGILTSDFKELRVNAGTGSGRIVELNAGGYRLTLRSDGILSSNANFSTTGTKNRLVDTNDYGERLLYCYEMASPMFGDLGEGIIGEDGNCYIFIDSIFARTVTLSQYQVFIQPYGNGECYVSARTPQYFIVSGTVGLEFGWELKAKQSDFDQLRLENDITSDHGNLVDMALDASAHIDDIRSERMTT